MSFAAPAWLLLILPWAGLVLLTLRAYRPKVYVSFLRLWPREEVTPDKRRGWRPPPAALVLLLLALLIGILGIASPRVMIGRPELRSCTIVVDDGVTMLAGSRFEVAAQAALEAITPLLAADAQVRIVSANGQQRLVGAAQLKVETLGVPNARDVHGMLQARLKALDGDEPVLLISDLAEVPLGVIVVRPTGRVDNVGIVSAAAHGGVCRLKIRNDSDRESVRVMTPAESHEVKLAGRGEVVTVDVPLNRFSRVALGLEDDLPDDNMRWVGEVHPRLVLGDGVSDLLGRFARAYSEANPPVEVSPTVAIGTAAMQTRCVAVTAGGEAASAKSSDVWPDHVLLDHVRLPKRIVMGDAALPPGDWQPLLEQGGKVLVAVDDAARRVFIGFSPEADDDAVAEYLVLLTNAVEFCGAGAFATSEPGLLESGWQRTDPGTSLQAPGLRAGLYSNGDEQIAIHLQAPELSEFDSRANADIPRQLLAYAQRDAQVQMAPWLWVASLLCMTVAVPMMGSPRRQA